MDTRTLEAIEAAGATKEHEPDEETRKSLLGALQLLCTKKSSRQFLRRHRAYPIIRNLDNWESSEAVKEIAFNVVNFLVRDEEEGDNEDLYGKTNAEQEEQKSGGADDNATGNTTSPQTSQTSQATAKSSALNAGGGSGSNHPRLMKPEVLEDEDIGNTELDEVD